ncbi:hypothetical protein Pan44_55530 [Caulifigura coniformis]|uniref:Lipoprotein n=2 Tax=Caulifigura coniformis TaxID=2527983 RepID=A0A517SMY0_9PLAN|nr:hypothetical protein Pan44_55530 [Caulifigura coniformis]
MLVAGAALSGCSGRPPDTLTADQQAAQDAEDKARLADEDRAEADYQKNTRKRKR